MAHLYLTRKQAQNQQVEAIMTSAASNSIVPAGASLPRLNSSFRRSVSIATSIYLDNDVEDLEMLLEAYFMQLDGIRNRILSVSPSGISLVTVFLSYLTLAYLDSWYCTYLVLSNHVEFSCSISECNCTDKLSFVLKTQGSVDTRCSKLSYAELFHYQEHILVELFWFLFHTHLDVDIDFSFGNLTGPRVYWWHRRLRQHSTRQPAKWTDPTSAYADHCIFRHSRQYLHSWGICDEHSMPSLWHHRWQLLLAICRRYIVRLLCDLRRFVRVRLVEKVDRSLNSQWRQVIRWWESSSFWRWQTLLLLWPPVRSKPWKDRGAPVGLGRNFLCSCFGVVDNRVSNMLWCFIAINYTSASYWEDVAFMVHLLSNRLAPCIWLFLATENQCYKILVLSCSLSTLIKTLKVSFELHVKKLERGARLWCELRKALPSQMASSSGSLWQESSICASSHVTSNMSTE